MTLDFFLTQNKRITRSLKKFIWDSEKQHSPQIFEAFLNTLDEELKTAWKTLSEIPAGPSRARKLHELIDQEIARADIESSCAKGCSACCHMEVEVTSAESTILAELVNQGHPIDISRLQKQAERSLQDPEWRKGIKNQTSRCIFLDSTGACGIYTLRPAMCRRHSVTTPAINCETANAPISIRYFPKVDIFISAACEDPLLEIGPLAKMLEKKIKAL